MLFTFPSRYWYTIGLSGVFSLAGWSRRIRAELLVLRVTQDTTRPHHASDTGLSPSMTELSRTFSSHSKCHGVVLQPRICIATHAVWALPRSLATTGGIIVYFLFLRVLRCFSSPRSPPYTAVRIAGLQPAGLSHSEILGSKVICTYPRLIAAYHVLHRLREPRHPPDALTFFRRLSNTLPAATIRLAHTFSCNSRYSCVSNYAELSCLINKKSSLFTYSLVSTCQRSLRAYALMEKGQWKKELHPLSFILYSLAPLRGAWWRITDSNR